MKIKKWKEVKPKEKGIILFTILSILLIVGVFFYQSFAIFKANTNQDLIEGNVENMGDLEFAFYIDGELSPTVPEKKEDYSLDTSSSYCKDMKTNQQISNVNWDNENWEVRVKNIQNTKTKCYLHFKTIYKEKILNEAIPDLMNGRLVPVKISDKEKPTDITYTGAVAGKVTKADITDEWYSYEKKEWANAVILKDGKTDTYQVGEEILQSDIESYFVWIPRYRYKLMNSEETFNMYTNVIEVGKIKNIDEFYDKYPNQATTNAFEIIFETKEQGISSTTQNGQYLTHPAFVSFNCNGLWVGKFETGYNQNESNKDVTPNDTWHTEGAEYNEENADKIIIKPNIYSWRNINISNAFYTSYEYKRELESHMMKNTEWGAVAYLTQSKYGRCTEIQMENATCEEVNMSNSEYFITGMSTTQAPTCGTINTNESCNHYGGPTDLNTLSEGDLYSYYKTESKGGSTTGNYTGIYDMAGGTNEYVMGVMQSSDEDTSSPTSGPDKDNNSGFKGPYSSEDGKNENGLPWPSRKYYDLYDYNISKQEYQRGKLGDGTKEFGPFYQVSYFIDNITKGIRSIGSYNGDSAFFLNPDAPWFIRGGRYRFGTESGVEAFVTESGKESNYTSFRIVLAP